MEGLMEGPAAPGRCSRLIPLNGQVMGEELTLGHLAIQAVVHQVVLSCMG